MSSPKRSTKAKRFVCDVCNEAKPPTAFPTLSATTCSACATKPPAPQPEPTEPPKKRPKLAIEQTPAPEPEPVESVFIRHNIEVDPENPTLQELAARTLARRRLLPFIQRFKPEYMAGWVHEDICRRLERFLEQVEAGNEPRLMMNVPVRHGKQLADDTAMLTANRGWTTHGDLVAGDEVFTPSGAPTKVVAVSEKTPSNVRVTMTDGSSVLCHENHEWTVYQRSSQRWLTVETAYWLNQSRLGKRRALKSGGRYLFQLPHVKPLEFPPCPRSMHPYVLGAWLGDGSAGKPCITGAARDGEIVRAIVECGYPVSAVCEHSTTKCLTTYFSGDNVSDEGLVPRRRGKIPGRMSQELMMLGVFHEKRIPAEYMRLPVADRLELLAGLIDTDGHVDARTGRVRIVTVSDGLRDDILELVRSFGMQCGCHTQPPSLSTSGIQGRRPTHYVNFTPTLAIPTRLPRKLIRGASPEAVAIASVERVDTGAVGHCIQVESPDGLYLAGRHLTPTHNSEIGSRHFAPWVLGKHPDWELIAASGSQSLSLSFSRYVRDLVRDPSYQALFPEMRLDNSSQSVENWNTTSRGGYLSAGVGTMITGRGAHILLLDDVVKDAEAADSQVIRDATWEWYMSTALTRLAPGGGVLGIMCMTGETPVRMADGSERRLDALKKSDEIATYKNGALSTSKVAAVRSSGRDLVLRIITISGRIVRANSRHPFLTETADGELLWTRARALTTGHKIVVCRDNGVNGKGCRARLTAATSLPSVEGSVPNTIPKKNGLTGIAARVQSTKTNGEKRGSSTATESQLPSTTRCTNGRTDVVRFAAGTPAKDHPRIIGQTSSQSITATKQVELGAFYATGVIRESDTLALSPLHVPLQTTSDFILDQVESVEVDGYAEVFDVQVADTENFIANGVVSHNTTWNEDDWAGRIKQVMATGEGDRFEIVSYPAINELGDEYILPDDNITQIPPGAPVPKGAQLTRKRNTALHPERYTLESLLKRKANYYALGQQRWWSALYQQNPTPEGGVFFTKDMFVEYTSNPARTSRSVYQAWDFAVTDKQKSDWTVGVTGFLDENDTLYILDVWRFKTDDGIELGTAIVQYAQTWDAACVAVEDGQIWKSIKANFDKACETKRFYPSYEVIVPLTDKRVRAQPLRGRMQQGKVQFPLKAPWYQDYKSELLRFEGGGRHDDQVDATAHLVRLVSTQAAPRTQSDERLPKSWKEKVKYLGRSALAGSHMTA